MPAFSAIMFDMDGLLLDTEQLILAAFIDSRRTFNLSDSPEVFLRCVGHRHDQTRHIIRESLEGRVDYDAFNDHWEAGIQRRLSGDIPERPGASQLLGILAAKGFVFGVATSTHTARARDQLGRSGLLTHIRHIVGGDQVERPKPDPQIYHMLAERLGTTAAVCLAFEDSNAGTRAALASGATTIQVPDLVAPEFDAQVPRHHIATSLLAGAVSIGLIEPADIAEHASVS